MENKILSFSSFLTEQAKQTFVFAFGRFQPISIGHEKLVNTVITASHRLKADHTIFVSRSQDPNRNPLSVEKRVSYLQKAFSGVNFQTSGTEYSSLINVAKTVNKKGYKHLVMIAGEDRVSDFNKLLQRYNGKDYNFQTIRVISAGSRDASKGGVLGASGTKLREAARKNDVQFFVDNVAKSLSLKDKHQLLKDTRTGLQVKESLDLIDRELLLEGVNDKAIFKAVFLAGGPGSGKDFVLQKTLSGHGLTEINSDKAFEFMLDKKALSKKMPEEEREKRDLVRQKAKSMTDLKQQLALHGRQGLIINGTGDNPEKYEKLKKALEDVGYETSMVFVHTDDETSQKRNRERGEMGGRVVPEPIRKEKWESTQKAKKKFAKMFGGQSGNKFIEYDNSVDLRIAPENVRQAKAQEMLGIFRSVRKFTEKEPTHPEAKKWIEKEQQRKGSPIEFRRTIGDGPPTISVSGSDSKERKPTQADVKNAQDAHQRSGGAEDRESPAAKLARRLGLGYMGLGRYGKEGKSTHMSVNNGQQLAKLATVKEDVNELFEEEFSGTLFRRGRNGKG